MASLSDIPQEIRALLNWVGWKREERTKKSGEVYYTKVPYNVRTGRCAKSNDPTTWSSFDDAVAALERGGYSGIGFCLSTPYVGVDLDGCHQDGCHESWAEEIIRELDSYSELSPSGTGIRIMVKGTLPKGGRQKDFKDREHHGVGLYDAARGRFLTMTGNRISGNGTIAERTAELQRIHGRLFPPKTSKQAKHDAGQNTSGTDEDLIAPAKRAKDGPKFARLWEGRWEGEYKSQSEADLALCCMLAFWTGRVAARIDALFRRSGLMRDKWDRDDYRDATIAKAIKQTTETWRPRGADQRSWSVEVDVDAARPTLDLLNACAVFGGRIHFTGVKRRGPMIVAEFKDGAEAIWPSIRDLTGFASSQAIIAEATQVLIPTPNNRTQKQVWEPAAQLILRLAGKDQISTTDKLRDEFRHIIYTTWKRAGSLDTTADADKEVDELFFAFLQECLEHRRNPAAEKPPRCCVWHDGKHCYVHQPSLIEWLSTPNAKHWRYDWGDVRNALLLLDFVPEQVHRSLNDEKVNVRLWRGPLELLVDDET